jgi:hypothetical protein
MSDSQSTATSSGTSYTTNYNITNPPTNPPTKPPTNPPTNRPTSKINTNLTTNPAYTLPNDVDYTTSQVVDFTTLFYTIFNKSNIVLLIWFLAIYIVVYCFLGFLFKKNNDSTSFELKLSRTLDLIFLFICLLFIITTFYSVSTTDKLSFVQDTLDSSISYIQSPISFFTTLIYIMILYTIVYLFRIPMTNETRPIFIYITEFFLWLFLLLIVIYDFFKYILGVPIDNTLNNINIAKSLPDNSIVAPVSTQGQAPPAPLASKYDTSSQNYGSCSNSTPTPTVDNTNEVFNVANNLYTYDDAQSVCSAYGAQLATYEQIEGAYNDGGEWCNYGWSDGQMAFFPTQKSTWDKLQKTTDHKNDCGRPGVNGGYIENPYVRFGVNCYGKKPNPSASDIDLMKQNQGQLHPKTQAEIDLENKVNYLKDNASTLFNLNAFNHNEWSEIKTINKPNVVVVNTSNNISTTAPTYTTTYAPSNTPTYAPTYTSSNTTPTSTVINPVLPS